MPRLRRIQQFVRVLDGFFDGLFLRSGFIDIGRSEQVTDEVAQEDEAVVKVGILAQQLLDHIRLIGDQVVHADAQQFAGILFAVERVGDISKVWVRGDFAVGKDSDLIDLVIAGKNIDVDYFENLIQKAGKIVKRQICYTIILPKQEAEYFIPGENKLLVWTK